MGGITIGMYELPFGQVAADPVDAFFAGGDDDDNLAGDTMCLLLAASGSARSPMEAVGGGHSLPPPSLAVAPFPASELVGACHSSTRVPGPRSTSAEGARRPVRSLT